MFDPLESFTPEEQSQSAPALIRSSRNASVKVVPGLDLSIEPRLSLF